MAKNLWKGGRTARGDSREDGGDPLEPAEAPYEMVGTTLRHKREERGEDLRYVAQILRIRYPYLKAIEDGKPDELPGPTYAVGFVRTYAEHLDLDSEKLVQQFKEEAAGLQAKADLHFPAPLPEGKIPSGAVLIVAVLLAASVYGAWMYLSSRDQQVAEIVPELPNQISEIIQGAPADSATEVSEQTAAVAAPAAEAAPVETAATPPAAPDTPATAAAEAPQATTETASPESEVLASSAETTVATSVTTELSEDTVSDNNVASLETAAEPTERTADAIPEPPAATDQPAVREEEAPTFAATLEEDAAPATNETEVAAVETAPEIERAPPKIYGGENPDARIVIHADADSWVEVRDGTTNELLLTRVLFKGDKYQVPDRGGLTLLTGNAGGLRIVVDGTAVPVLGPLGAVRRNVLLEPEPLLGGASAGRGDTRAPRTQSQTSESDLPSR